MPSPTIQTAAVWCATWGVTSVTNRVLSVPVSSSTHSPNPARRTAEPNERFADLTGSPSHSTTLLVTAIARAVCRAARSVYVMGTVGRFLPFGLKPGQISRRSQFTWVQVMDNNAYLRPAVAIARCKKLIRCGVIAAASSSLANSYRVSRRSRGGSAGGRSNCARLCFSCQFTSARRSLSSLRMMLFARPLPRRSAV